MFSEAIEEYGEEFVKRYNIELRFYQNFGRVSPYFEDPKGNGKMYSTRVSSITKLRASKILKLRLPSERCTNEH